MGWSGAPKPHELCSLRCNGISEAFPRPGWLAKAAASQDYPARESRKQQQLDLDSAAHQNPSEENSIFSILQ
eukprot:COSAG01_NODE_247_length_20443_cov_52.339543_24_plen_72_part_00